MRKSRKPVQGRGTGAATHNRAAEPGKLEVTIWGQTREMPGRKRREMAIVLDEDAVNRLIANLSRFGFYV